MGIETAIVWTDSTWNPWWHCVPISEACTHGSGCYAASLAKRFGCDCFGVGKTARTFGDRHWAEPITWAAEARKVGERHKVFCMSMGDICEDLPALEPMRQRLWPIIRQTADALDWILLTKRAENLGRMIPEDVQRLAWLGVTVENQRRADERVPHLRELPAAVRFISVEPLLDPVVLSPYLPSIDWVIIGAQSGPRAIPMDPTWASALAAQTRAAGTALFVKQLTAPRGRGTNGVLHEPEQFPADLRTREFPRARIPRPIAATGQASLPLGD